MEGDTPGSERTLPTAVPNGEEGPILLDPVRFQRRLTVTTLAVLLVVLTLHLLDEFSLILPDTGREGAIAVAERIGERLRAGRFLSSDGLAVHLTASIGVATLPDVAGSAEELIRAADKAMYLVKARGKNGIHVAEAQE